MITATSGGGLGDRSDGLPRPYRVASLRQENHRTRTVILDGPVDAEPGQFLSLIHI